MSEAPSPAVQRQVRRNAEARADLVAEFGLLTAAEVSERLGMPIPDPRVVIDVPSEDGPRYPGYQFDAAGRLRLLIAEVLVAFDTRLSGWELALWFTSSNGWLGGIRPVDVLDGTAEDRAAVVDAARHLAAEVPDIREEAHQAVLAVEMLTAAQVAEALELADPQEVEESRTRGVLLGVPLPGGGYGYPVFQVDPVERRVHPVVAIINRLFRAADDPWGVGSWWINPHAALAPGQAPMDLLVTDVETDLLVMVGLAPEVTASDAGAVADLLAPFTAQDAARRVPR